MRAISEIIVHCTATRADWWASRTLGQKVGEIRRWHVEDRKFKEIGYHFLIDRDGKVATGRPLEQVGAHVQGHNTGTIGISLFGGHGSAATDAFADNFTPAQDAALRKLIAEMQEHFGPLKISGHNQYAAKACPGFDVPAWYAGLGRRQIVAPVPVSPSPEQVAAALKPLTDHGTSPWFDVILAILSPFRKFFGGSK